MPFAFEASGLLGLLLVRPTAFPDDRGFFLERYKESDFRRAGISERFVQDNHSASTRGVLRGLHYQVPPGAQAKLVWVLEGGVWDVAVDVRPDSPTYRQWSGIELSADNRLMFYIPPGFAHGFVVLSERAEFAYKCSAEYDKGAEAGFRWDDPEIGIEWPIRDVTVSAKDQCLPLMKEAIPFPRGYA